MNKFYPALSLENFFFAYDDEVLVWDFFNSSLGKPYDSPSSIGAMGTNVLIELQKQAPEEYNLIVPKVFIPNIPVNVAVITTWLLINEKKKVSIHPNSGYLLRYDFVMENRPLTLALTNDLVVNGEGQMEGLMDIESMGLMDCARRTVNQVRSIGFVLSPITSVDENFMSLIYRMKSESNIKE